MKQPKMIYPASLSVLREAIPAAAKHFGTSEYEALTWLFIILSHNNYNGKDQRSDTEITCAVCADDQWWVENYGPLASAAQWWHCGPFGLNCENPRP